MPPVTIHVAASPGESRAVALQHGTLLDYAIHRPGAPDGVGDRLRGRVIAVVPAMAGAFIALPNGIEGFLPDSAAPAGLGTGDAITVLITRAALGGKGPRLSARTDQAGPGPPTLLQPGPDATARLQALHPGATLHAGWNPAIEDEIDGLAHPTVALPGGLVAHIHPTPALVAIDLDSAATTSERRDKTAAQKAANLAALPGLARSIRLRNLSGAIVVDLAGMAPRARTALAAPFAVALANDPLNPRFLGFTALGLAEILRPRIHPPLHELLAGPHAAALAALRALAAAVHSDPATPRRLHAAPDIARAFDEDPIARADLASRTGRPLIIRTDPALPPGHWTVEPIPRA